jgi:hypothetical protein
MRRMWKLKLTLAGPLFWVALAFPVFPAYYWPTPQSTFTTRSSYSLNKICKWKCVCFYSYEILLFTTSESSFWGECGLARASRSQDSCPVAWGLLTGTGRTIVDNKSPLWINWTTHYTLQTSQKGRQRLFKAECKTAHPSRSGFHTCVFQDRRDTGTLQDQWSGWKLNAKLRWPGRWKTSSVTRSASMSIGLPHLSVP